VVSKLRDLMSEVDKAREQAWEDEIKLTAARLAWVRQKEFVPSRKGTWARWWEKKFGNGETLNEFATRMHKARLERNE